MKPMTDKTFNLIRDLYQDSTTRMRASDALYSNMIDNTIITDDALLKILGSGEIDDIDLSKVLGDASTDIWNRKWYQAGVDSINTARSKYPNASTHYAHNYIPGFSNYLKYNNNEDEILKGFATPGINGTSPINAPQIIMPKASTTPKDAKFKDKVVSTQDGKGNEIKGKGIKGMFASFKANPTVNSVGTYMKAHPWMSTGLGIGGAANLAGLFDNNKIGGQLLGGALGGVATIPFQMTPQGRVLSAMIGGGLGSLYDKLAAEKEQAYAQQQMY